MSIVGVMSFALLAWGAAVHLWLFYLATKDFGWGPTLGWTVVGIGALLWFGAAFQ